MSNDRTIAYFSMEIGLEVGMPTYSGGLGILAGDTIRSAADLKVPMVAVTLLHRKGYFYQRLDPSGWQTEEPAQWVVEDFLQELPARADVTIEGRTVHIRAWKYEVRGVTGSTVPVYFLDTDLDENSEWDRTLTHFLYGGDSHYRLCQEVVLGIGGLRMLQAIGYRSIERYHMNEGHASLLALELLDEHATQAGRQPSHEDVEAVRRQCVFTTHTPVPAGHDQFPMELVARVIGDHAAFRMKDVFCCEGVLNMTYLALNLSHYVNGVPSLSILDGWWIEGCIEGVTGWAIGENGRGMNGITDRYKDAESHYDKLDRVVIPSFYQDRDRFIEVMRHAIALNGSFFNTQRMMQQYVLKAYFS